MEGDDGQARSRGTYPSKSAKGPLLATNWVENGVIVGGLRGEVQKVHFLGPKGPLLWS